MRTARVLLFILSMCVAIEGRAFAQGSFVASLGKVYGGDVQTAGRSWALALGGSGAHSIGSEVEFSKNNNVTDLGGQQSNIYSLMASLLVTVPMHTVRPYALFGYGFIRQRTETSTGGVLSDLSKNDVGYNAGAGVTVHFARSAGVRFDLRHFKIRKADGMGFQRMTVGIVLGN